MSEELSLGQAFTLYLQELYSDGIKWSGIDRKCFIPQDAEKLIDLKNISSETATNRFERAKETLLDLGPTFESSPEEFLTAARWAFWRDFGPKLIERCTREEEVAQACGETAASLFRVLTELDSLMSLESLFDELRAQTHSILSREIAVRVKGPCKWLGFCEAVKDLLSAIKKEWKPTYYIEDARDKSCWMLSLKDDKGYTPQDWLLPHLRVPVWSFAWKENYLHPTFLRIGMDLTSNHANPLKVTPISY